MTDDTPPHSAEFLVLSRGHWQPELPLEVIERAIDDFYRWHDEQVRLGTMRPGQRLAPPARRVSRQGIVDGPYTEAKEVIGGYWFILAPTLDEAARIAAGNPCIACGLEFEIRPIEPVRASAYARTCETPVREARA